MATATREKQSNRLRPTTELAMILNRCGLMEYETYLSQHGFATLKALRLLSIEDHARLPDIQLGHLKMIIHEIDQEMRKADQYQHFIQLLGDIEEPQEVFRPFDEILAKYAEWKQQYEKNYRFKIRLEGILKEYLSNPISVDVSLVKINDIHKLIRNSNKIQTNMTNAFRQIGQVDNCTNSPMNIQPTPLGKRKLADTQNDHIVRKKQKHNV